MWPRCGSGVLVTARQDAVAQRRRMTGRAEGQHIMSLFMDIHTIPGGVKTTDAAQAHQADLQSQAKYGVNYARYWVDEAQGRIFCLVEAPDAETAAAVHREAHGLVADQIYAVVEGS
jgi:hypothetical protein